ncbi:mechanosensitive ion channel family protein [Hymenobacter arizonensis]|uniref:mechanosensitive ion channel family protein n=1 Tax=Hymenobacter arizonensis TaxID=1227077 RepID=UPI001F23F6FA|nr:mechanosensitive ion channel family protein [Hymenobacter arizonensis]
MTEVERAFDLLSGKLLVWFRQLIVMLPNLVVAAILLILTFVGARIVRRVVRRVLPRVSASDTLNNLLTTMLYIFTLLVGTFFVLTVLNLDKTVTSLLAGVGIIGLALGFAFQDIAANFISGVIIAVQRPFNVGDVIETDKFFGTIERISLRTLNIRQTTGELVIMPNRKVFENPLINFTQQTMRRVDLECGVAYNSDLELVQQVVQKAVSAIPELVPERPLEVMFTAFAESAITFQVRFWVPYRRQFDYVSARSEAIIRIKRAFDDHGISIPFPIRTLHLHPEATAMLAPALEPKRPDGDQ